MTCSPPTSPTARRPASAMASWRRSSISTATPGYRSSAWILPLLYCSLAILLLTGLLWPTRLLVRRKYKAELRPRPAGSSGPTARAGSRRSLILAAPRRLAGRCADAARRSCQPGDASTRSCCCCELLSIVVFIGGFAVMLWYAYTRVASGLALARQGVEHPARHCRPGWSSTSALVFKLIGSATNY